MPGGKGGQLGQKFMENFVASVVIWYGDSVCQLALFRIKFFSVTIQNVRKARQRRCIAREASGGVTVLCPPAVTCAHRLALVSAQSQ
jgi:hypothetical protein